MNKSNQLKNEIDQEEAKTRTDLRNETIVTIDGDDAKDLDDAILFKKIKEWKLLFRGTYC